MGCVLTVIGSINSCVSLPRHSLDSLGNGGISQESDSNFSSSLEGIRCTEGGGGRIVVVAAEAVVSTTVLVGVSVMLVVALEVCIVWKSVLVVYVTVWGYVGELSDVVSGNEVILNVVRSLDVVGIMVVASE